MRKVQIPGSVPDAEQGIPSRESPVFFVLLLLRPAACGTAPAEPAVSAASARTCASAAAGLTGLFISVDLSNCQSQDHDQQDQKQHIYCIHTAHPIPSAIPIRWTRTAAIQAIEHWNRTTPNAQCLPSSRLIEAMAATHGVYSRLKTRTDAAVSDDITALTPPSFPYSTLMMETTLSLAMNPLTREVTIRQSPRPAGLNSGTRKPEITARILSLEFVTRFSSKSKLCRNQTTMVATRITENALCRGTRLQWSQPGLRRMLSAGNLSPSPREAAGHCAGWADGNWEAPLQTELPPP